MLYESAGIRVELDDQVATLWLDAGNRRNLFNLQFLDELEAALLAVKQAGSVDVLIVRSAKQNVFSAGCDGGEVRRAESAEQRSVFAARGQQVLQLLGTLLPQGLTVALIEGECRSGGLELALVCDYRVAVTRPETCFSLTEIDRGNVPGWGATVRLPRVVGMRPALRMLLEGAELTAGRAAELGLVDRLFEAGSMRAELQAFVDKLQDKPTRLPAPRRWRERVRDCSAITRAATAALIRREFSDLDAGAKPAADSMIRAVLAGYLSPSDALAIERSAFGELTGSEVFRDAVELEDKAASSTRLNLEPSNPIPAAPDRVGIVGGGDAGSSAACWFALKGMGVVLKEIGDESLHLAETRLDERFRLVAASGMASASQIEAARKRVRKTTSWNGFDDLQFVIEAAEEDLGVKRGIFHELEQHVRPRTILASAASTVNIEAIQAELRRPGRVAGFHVPAADFATPLVEIVCSPVTDASVLATLESWARQWGKTPVRVNDRPGRLVCRVQLAALSESVLLVSEGLPPELVDRQMRRAGMRRGPLETIDAIGFDNLARLVANMHAARGDTFARNLLLERFRAYGWDGREGGEGFYKYRRARATPNHLARMISWYEAEEDVISHYVFDPAESLELGVERVVLRTINEAAACLPEEPDADPRVVDLAVCLGMGWRATFGGPLRYADGIGLQNVVDRLNEFTERFGKRFEPCVELARRAEAGESFYGSSSREVVEAPARPWRMAG